MVEDVTALPETTALDRLKHCYEAWDRTRGGSLELWRALFSPRFACLTLCESVNEGNGARSCGGREDALNYFRNCATFFDLQSHKIDRYVQDGSRIVAIGRVRWRHHETGNMVDMEKLDVWDFDGLHATSFTEFYDTAYMRNQIVVAETAA